MMVDEALSVRVAIFMREIFVCRLGQELPDVQRPTDLSWSRKARQANKNISGLRCAKTFRSFVAAGLSKDFYRFQLNKSATWKICRENFWSFPCFEEIHTVDAASGSRRFRKLAG